MAAAAVAFAAVALLQYNDPDPLTWVAIYGAASAMCGVAAARGRAPVSAAIALAALTTVWALVLIARLPGPGVYAQMFGAWRMQGAGVEQARESVGLLLVAACSALIAAASRSTRVPRR